MHGTQALSISCIRKNNYQKSHLPEYLSPKAVLIIERLGTSLIHSITTLTLTRKMGFPSPFERRSWEKYPIYLTDEKYDNLDEDPRDPRNTTKTLAQELADCGEEDAFIDASPDPKLVTESSTGLIPSDPGKRAKARIGRKFSKKPSTVSQTKGNDKNGDATGTTNSQISVSASESRQVESKS